MLNTLDKYLIKIFFNKMLILSIIFFSLIYVLTIFEEITFFNETSTNFYFPFLIAFFDAPTSLLEIFPFITFISIQLFFLEIFKKKENELIKTSGLNNLYLIKILSLCAFVFGLLVIIFYYPISSKLKFVYSDIKNIYSSDGKYLKYYSNNGLWIKDEINENIYIINGEVQKDNYLNNVFISKFDKDFNLIENIFSNNVDISKNTWKIKDPIIFKDNKQVKLDGNLKIDSHFNVNKINNTFTNLYALNFFQLFNLKNENRSLGYSSDDINLHLIKIFILPIFYCLMVVISAILMLNIKKDKPYLFHLIFGILISVLIYYGNNLFKVFGLTEKIPIYMSVIFPILVLLIISLIGLVRINEK
jgi:lipopolysaccharide export system permease protein